MTSVRPFSQKYTKGISSDQQQQSTLVHNKPKGHVFVFSNEAQVLCSDESSSDCEGTLDDVKKNVFGSKPQKGAPHSNGIGHKTAIKLRRKHCNAGASNDLTRDEHEMDIVAPKEDQMTYQIQIKPDDSLHTLALKYSCSVWELKRANNLVSDTDFYAHQTIRIPASKHSLRAELLSEEGTLVTNDFAPPPPVNNEVAVDVDVRKISIAKEDQFLRHLDADLEKIRASTCFLKDSLEDVTESLGRPVVKPLTLDRRFKLSGDCGINWKAMLVMLLLLCVLLPIGLLVYFSSHTNEQSGVSTSSFGIID